MIPIYKPYLPNYILKYAHEALNSLWISSVGNYKKIVSEKMEEILKVKHVLLVNNGTSAVHLVSKALHYINPKIKNIIVPNNVYVAAWNGFLFDNHFNLIPIDSDLNTWNFDINKISTIADDTSILAVHNLGNIVNVPKIADKFCTSNIIEDNCEGFLGRYDGHLSGTRSLCSAVSFFGNKNITSGEGGAVITNDDDIYDYVNKLHGQGQSDIKYIHDVLGYNYRMTNVQASILYGQILHLNEIIELKEYLFDRYRKSFCNIDNIRIQQIEDNTKHANWMMGVRIINSPGYDYVETFFKKIGIEIRPMFYPMSTHSHLKKYAKKEYETNSSILSKECFIIPSYPGLSNKEIDTIIESVKTISKDIFKKEQK